jgi:3-methyladenine DNA glycosylase AlkD
MNRPARLAETLAALERKGTAATRNGFARYGIVAPRAFGVSMGDIQAIARRLGRDQALAQALWGTGWYEARLLAGFVAEPERLTPAGMDRWARDFDNWAVCDTLCFHLFDRTPHAWAKVRQWSGRRAEFVRRAGFALLAALALHDKRAPDAAFLRLLPLAEAAADDERNFVKKAVSWALRSVGRRNPQLRAEVRALAGRLRATGDPTARWIAADVLRDLAKRSSR